MILFLLSHLGSLQYSRATLSITLQLYQVPCSLVDPVRETKTKDQNHLDKDVAIQEFNLEKVGVLKLFFQLLIPKMHVFLCCPMVRER